MIKTIEIICKPCHKCELLEERIKYIIRCMEMQQSIKIKYEFKHNTNIRDVAKYSFNMTQMPILLINGNVEFAGNVKEEHLIRIKLEEIMKEA